MKTIVLLLIFTLTIQSSYGENLYWFFYTKTGSVIAVPTDAMPYFTTKSESGEPSLNLYIITEDDAISQSFEKISYVKLVDIDEYLQKSKHLTRVRTSTSIKQLEEDSQPQDFNIYTIDGKKVTSDRLVPNTIYIQNGKKFITK